MAHSQRLSRNLQLQRFPDVDSEDIMNIFIDDKKSKAATAALDAEDKISVHGFDDPSNDSEDDNIPVLDGQDSANEDDWTSFVMMGAAGDTSDDYSDSSSDSMPSRPHTPLPQLSLEDAMSDWIAEFLWESCTAGVGNPKYTFSAQPPPALSPQIKAVLARIPFRSSPCSLYLALWYTSRLPVSFHLPHFAFPPGSPQYDFYMDFIGLGKASNAGTPEGPDAAPYRLFCLGLFFSYKWLEEYDMKSSVWCDIFKLPPRVLNSLEMNALRIFHHTLAIDELEWMRWLLELQCDRPAFPSLNRIRPSDVDAARRISIDWLLDHTCLPLGGEGAVSWFRPESSPPPSLVFSDSSSDHSDSPIPTTPEAYFIGKSERIMTKRMMLERELQQLGMTEEEYDAEEDHTPICSVEESLRRVMDSAEAYRSAEDCRIAKSNRKEMERARLEQEKIKLEQERIRVEKERADRERAKAERIKRAEAEAAAAAAKRAAEAEAAKKAADEKIRRETAAAARWAKQEWRERSNGVVKESKKWLPGDFELNTTVVREPMVSAVQQPIQRPLPSGPLPAVPSKSPKRLSPSPKAKSTALSLRNPSAGHTLTRRSSFSAGESPMHYHHSSFHHHRVQQQRSHLFGTVFVPLRRGPSRSLSHPSTVVAGSSLTTGTWSSGNKGSSKGDGWMEMV